MNDESELKSTSVFYSGFLSLETLVCFTIFINFYGLIAEVLDESNDESEFQSPAVSCPCLASVNSSVCLTVAIHFLQDFSPL